MINFVDPKCCEYCRFGILVKTKDDEWIGEQSVWCEIEKTVISKVLCCDHFEQNLSRKGLFRGFHPNYDCKKCSTEICKEFVDLYGTRSFVYEPKGSP